MRERLRLALRQGWHSAFDLSGAAGIPEREVAGHLEHLRKSASATNDRFAVEPATCRACGFEFRERTRLTSPSRCPNCRSERIFGPRFMIRTTA